MLLFDWLEQTAIARWVGESLWGYPILLSLHAVGLAVAVGVFVMRDLRLAGFFEGISFNSLSSLQKLGWGGLVINAISGALLFTSQATMFVGNAAFLLKISMIFLAAMAAALIQGRIANDSMRWDASGAATGAVRALAMLSITLWLGAIVAGRLIAYV